LHAAYRSIVRSLPVALKSPLKRAALSILPASSKIRRLPGLSFPKLSAPRKLPST
jgi:hypothetical protein